MAMFSELCFPLFLLILLPNTALSQTTNNITVGTTLTATDNSSPWLSPSTEFAFGFQKIKNQNDHFLLSIWYANIPDKTIVWYAFKTNSSAVVPRGSQVNLTADRGLVLVDPQGKEVWSSEIVSGEASHAVMQDEGNFVIFGSEKLWESFDHPSDTLLPGQSLSRGEGLLSRWRENVFSKGRFELKLQQDGNLVLYSVNLPTRNDNRPYYASNTDEGSNSSTAGNQLVFNETGNLYLLRVNNRRLNVGSENLVSVSATDNYIRVTLEFDGVFTKYYLPKRSNRDGKWTVLWSIPENICHDSILPSGDGVCGHNSICTLNEDSRPTCQCPKKYSFVDPNDEYGSCKPDFIQGCAEDELTHKLNPNIEDLYDVEELPNVDWPLSAYVALRPINGDDCKDSCLKDCLCAVSIFREGSCWKKKLPLSNGMFDASLNSRAFIKILKDNITLDGIPYVEEEKRKKQDKLIRVGAALLGTSVLVLAATVCVGFFFIRKKKSSRSKKISSPKNIPDFNLRSFTYEELEKATNEFRDELGRGAFGTVYKGILDMDSSVIVIAVKKLNFLVAETEKEFKNEVNVIAQTHHKNLVRLLGYCNDGQNRLLVYEYLQNGTLAKFAFGDLKPNWKQRVGIALDIAKGLLYLHEECNTQIIHCDIKPQNILLDEYNNAKISDFGLAKPLMMNQSQTNTAIRGTKGYVAPEWFRSMPITSKVDVYSFGVVLLEIVCCRKNVDMEIGEEGKEILTDWAYDCFTEGSLDMLVDYEVDALNDRKKLESYVKVSMWCIQENPCLRPNMRKVVQMLEGVVEVEDPPSPLPYSITTTI
ncbi:G-type lectin S-receptor-like serine/threonine-protein kinase RLK1 [Cannabis sativa]|uniref:G-type lectin S-receptor-like serine/threonine-protein kinase RLK1 n=1 Tax=Cannabis sativa TaxID=3483 RepID=UPI0029CAA4C1|nr:G-type lectin S-receptor-like serine/threonine-protein kinase RLK1 [Cannabis sativa]